MSGAYCGVLVFARFWCHVLWCNGALVPGCHVPRCSGVMWAWCKLKPAVNSQPSLASPHLESSTTCDSGDQTLTVNKQIGSHWDTCSPPPWSSEDTSHLVISQTVFKMSSMPIIVRQHASWNIFQCQLLPIFYFLIPPFTLSSSQVQWNVIDGVTGESGEDTFLFRFDGQTYNLWLCYCTALKESDLMCWSSEDFLVLLLPKVLFAFNREILKIWWWWQRWKQMWRWQSMKFNLIKIVFFLRMAPPLLTRSLLALCLAACVSAQGNLSSAPAASRRGIKISIIIIKFAS